MKTILISILCMLVVSACASTPEVSEFTKSKITNLSSQQAIENIKSVVSANENLFLDSINDDLVVISSNDKDRYVACRVGFGDTFRSAQSKFYFQLSGNVWSVRSEHAGRAGIGRGNSDIVEFKGVDIPCVSTGLVETSIFQAL